MPQQRCAGGVSFTLTRRRVKNLNLRVRADGSVAVSAPSSMPVGVIDAFVARRAAWVLRTQDRFARRRAAEAAQPLPDRGEALAGMRALCEAWWPYFAGRCPGPMPAVRVRDMHTRWGSCSLRTRTTPPPSGRRSPVCCPTTPRGAPCCAPERPDREGTFCPTTNDIPR
ncbi:YgjP-like metallopeptidase domain-containing protein [Gemmiger gallinarum]|uniref:YgjP-like metallopeptidase domain-containing protein n=1 Tax=Gemmiger gallinarum TaxID=2779354 RepID=UPI002E2CD280|nr:YgjP-like metallopeptidase domain-containing protein [Gemmiger gallinarum]